MSRGLVSGGMGLVASAFLWWPVAVSYAGDSVAGGVLASPSDSVLSALSSAPPEAGQIAPVLRHVVEVVQSNRNLQRELTQLRTEHDAIKTKLAAVNGEVEILAQRRQQLTDQLAALEHQQQERFDAFRKELEAKLEGELTQTSQQIANDLKQDFTRQVQAFEARLRDAMEKSAEQERQLKARELEQLTREVEVQTQELLDRVARLNANADLAKSIQRSTTELLGRRKVELESRRSQLTAERDALFAKRCVEFMEGLKQQQAAEHQQRMTVKEASVRSTMAELLHQSQQEESGQLIHVRQSLAETAQRYDQVAQAKASLTTRADSLDQAVASKTKSIQELEAERQASLMRLEQAFQKPSTALEDGVLSWFGQTIHILPPELATDLGPLQQRLMALAEQERQLTEQQRVLRERELALQLSREMKAQYERAQLKQQQEQAAKAHKADDLIARTSQFADRGKFDEALALVDEAQMLNPPQLNRIASFREELLAAKERARRQAQAAQLERIFKHAMEVFQQGRYEEAVSLFEQVIQQGSALGALAPSLEHNDARATR